MRKWEADVGRDFRDARKEWKANNNGAGDLTNEDALADEDVTPIAGKTLALIGAGAAAVIATLFLLPSAR
jgi:hypothetical protein